MLSFETLCEKYPKVCERPELKGACDKVVQLQKDNFRAIGEVMAEVDEMGLDAINAFAWFLSDLGYKPSDIRATRLVASGALDERLLGKGVPASKLVLMDKDTDQTKILRGDPLEVLKSDGSVAKCSWDQMTEDQRNQVVAKNGKILPPKKQRVFGNGPKQVFWSADGCSWNPVAKRLAMLRGHRELSRDGMSLAQDLFNEGQLSYFIKYLGECQKILKEAYAGRKSA